MSAAPRTCWSTPCWSTWGRCGDDPRPGVPPLAGPVYRGARADRDEARPPADRGHRRERVAAPAGQPAGSAAARTWLDTGHAAAVRHLRTRPGPAGRAGLAVPVAADLDAVRSRPRGRRHDAGRPSGDPAGDAGRAGSGAVVPGPQHTGVPLVRLRSREPLRSH